jgi:redox-sensitive bicupin YhaK (pirin superfamily)
MTAGRGIVHAERPLADDAVEKFQHGLQLWTSLPRALKMMPPRYQRIDASDIAEKPLHGARLRVIAGEVDGVKGPAETLMPAFLAHVNVQPGAALAIDVSTCHEAAAYVIEGEGDFGPERRAKAGELVLFANAGGALPIANAGTQPLEVMVLGGAPAEGPLVFHGPFVMNSMEQVRAAEIAFRTGRMGTLADTP